MGPWFQLPVIIGLLTMLVVLGLAVVVLWKVATGAIDLTYLIAEPDNKASLSRFQFLIFTFVVAGVFLLLSIESGTFVDIPPNVLVLLGISGGSYVVSKGITANASKTNTPPPADGKQDGK
jgi:hypothetical protein